MTDPGTGRAPRELAVPAAGAQRATEFVREHLAHLVMEDAADIAASSIRGGQRAADAALASYDVAGYASTRNEVAPVERRGASKLSPYIRHGLLTLPRVWNAVEGGPARDVHKFRDELLWQEYARHWYARLGERSASGVRRELPGTGNAEWDRSMACIDLCLDELEQDGWLVNQTRMWLSSHWAVRLGGWWRDGEDEFFRHLLDGSRAANRLGWQWTTGVGSSKPYGFSRWQVRKRAPGLCDTCVHRDACPIEGWPSDPTHGRIDRPAMVKSSTDLAEEAGPGEAIEDGHDSPDHVWLTAESLGDDDPALTEHPGLPVVFVFDEALLARVRLSAKRLVFLVETLAEIAEDRDVELWLGNPVDVLTDRRVAVTFAPVPGFRRIAAAVEPCVVHPWPWLRRPTGRTVSSFSAWRKSLH